MLIEGQFSVAAAPRVLLQHLFDVRLMASCLPGCEMIEPIDEKKYRAVILMAMAGIKARFDMEVEITNQDDHNVWATTQGEEGGRASTLHADSQITLAACPQGTLVNYRSDVSITGRLGRFALGMMKKKAQGLGDEFAVNLRKKLEEIAAQAVACGQAVVAVPPGQTAAREAMAEPPAPASASHRSWWQSIWAWLTARRSSARN